MIPLLDTSADLDLCASEIGCGVGQLMTPLTGFSNKARPKGYPWAIDNGAYAGFNAHNFKRRISREGRAGKQGCLFVAMPDVVGNARRTMECFDYWASQYHGVWPLALVAQDGIDDVAIPWGMLAAIFIGGTTSFKSSSSARDVAITARTLGKHVHVGRVNDPVRYAAWVELGDTCGGTGLSKHSHQRLALLGNDQGSLSLGGPDDVPTD